MNLQHKVIGKEITIDLCNKDNISIGDKFELDFLPEFSVSKIIEKRLPAIKTEANPNNVNHHEDGIMWFKIKGDIV